MVNDYIRREDMLNAVEQLNIISSVDGMGVPTGAEDFRVQFLGTVLKVEPADVVPVVRCRDCKYYGIRLLCNLNDNDFHWCNLNENDFEPDDFCSYGERREE